MNERVNNVVAAFEQNKIEAFLVLKEINVRYLTEFPAEESCLLVCKKRAYYITDSRYFLCAKNQLNNFTVRCYKESLFQEILDILRSHKVKVLGLDERHINVSQYKLLKAKLKGTAKILGVNNLIESLRAVKEKAEIRLIRKALQIHQQAHLYLKETIVPQLTEQDILKKLEAFVRSRGVTFSFDPIIASGVNSCFPHAQVTRRKVRPNDIILVDMGIDYKGYKSDLTRVFFLGRIPKSIREIYQHVYQAQQLALRDIKAGVFASKIDQIARNYFKKHGIEKYFIHALGHGVGMEVHETPRLSSVSQEKLQEGMVVTVEPAIYFPNKFGIRLEEMVVVTKEGCELLSDNIN